MYFTFEKSLTGLLVKPHTNLILDFYDNYEIFLKFCLLDSFSH